MPQNVRFGRGIVGAGHPDRRAAMLPRVARPVSLPCSPGSGTVLKRHTSFPVRTSNAAIQQLVPNSLVAGPEDHLVLHDERRDVQLQALSSSPGSVWFQISLPVLASIAIRCPS